MNGYFKPLRRKIGVVTVVMACLLAIGWASSLTIVEQISFRTEGEEILQLANGSIRWWSFRTPTSPTIEWWVTKPLDDWNSSDGDTDMGWQFKWIGIGFYREDGAALRIIRCRSITIPLTLLSAWLLLSKSCKSPATTISEPTSDEAA